MKDIEKKITFKKVSNAPEQEPLDNGDMYVSVSPEGDPRLVIVTTIYDGLCMVITSFGEVYTEEAMDDWPKSYDLKSFQMNISY